MKIGVTVLFLLAAFCTTAHGKVVTATVAYEADGKKMEGFFAYDDSTEGKRPSVLVVHEWWGLNDYARSRARQLASMGYAAFALDMYGEGKTTTHPKEAAGWTREITENIQLWRKRAEAGLNVLRENPRTDPSRIAAIGYCFGGATVQQLAYGGADVRGVVSFHGSLVPPPEGGTNQVKAKILICHGSADPFTKPDQLEAYLVAMNKTDLDWQMIIFGGAKHSFTNPEADKAGMEALQYDRSADLRSWSYMKVFFDEIFKGKK